MYIPKFSEKYNLLPNTRKYNFEIIIPDNKLLFKIERITGYIE